MFLCTFPPIHASAKLPVFFPPPRPCFHPLSRHLPPHFIPTASLSLLFIYPIPSFICSLSLCYFLTFFYASPEPCSPCPCSHVSGNFLNFSLDGDTFSPYSHLVFLDLSNNSLRVLPVGVFLVLGRLKILDLRDNLLTAVSNSTFLGLSNLRTLHLEGNAISTLHGWAFYGLSSLSMLDLSHQRLARLHRHAFLGLRSLLSLNASNNRLQRLSSGSLSGLSTLLSLDLRDNQLSVVEPSSPPSPPSNSCKSLHSTEKHFSVVGVYQYRGQETELASVVARSSGTFEAAGGLLRESRFA
ncbi:G-protein coupled receptor GRL101-like [Eriocheir sinensis]|uniref:G-protein coupled receptor GRL101-like n=1 Tax=Eriocheir sinensis TaxID=95602 RepID=UPI0021C66D8E|nr:G-protein coupled receptor GRL101-like [Eriocheir sinensis]